MQQEEWRDVVGYEGLYKVSDLGRFWILETRCRGGRRQYARIIEGNVGVTLFGPNGTRRLHHLSLIVLETFVGPNPDGQNPGQGKTQCCHKDDNRTNNQVSNLYWGDARSNKLDAVKNNVANIPKGERHRDAKMSDEKVLEARRLRDEGWLVDALCKKYDMTSGPMSLLLRGITWKHLNKKKE